MLHFLTLKAKEASISFTIQRNLLTVSRITGDRGLVIERNSSLFVSPVSVLDMPHDPAVPALLAFKFKVRMPNLVLFETLLHACLIASIATTSLSQL
jgi:hypothetical protein